MAGAVEPRKHKHLGNVAFLVPGVPVALRASRLARPCEQDEPLPAQLLAKRRRLDLSLAEAAAILGVTRWTLGIWESGKQRPSVPSGRVIAAFLGREP
jgi:DNA-binding XRE family transcriptional regulator